MKLTVFVLFGIFAFLSLTQSREEQEFQSWMKTTFATSGSLRKNIESKTADGAAADAAKLEAVFKQVGEFFAKRNADDAVKWSQQAVTAAREAGAAAKAGDFEKAAASMKGMNATCTACHAAHRERLPEGGYKIK